jgi:prolyl oligopeptidase
MKFCLLLGAVLVSVLILGCVTTSRSKHHYPATATTNQVDVYHGVTVKDPYRWLEDDNSAATKAWVEAQNKVTFDYLATIPERAAIKARLTELWNFERYGVPFKEGGRYFYYKNDGLQNQSVLYTLPTLESEPTVLLDPNKLSTDGTVALRASRSVRTAISWRMGCPWRDRTGRNGACAMCGRRRICRT